MKFRFLRHPNILKGGRDVLSSYMEVEAVPIVRLRRYFQDGNTIFYVLEK